ncbi:MAG: undecaprenyldiphospho-muramoylpentapeptide beta-N-acetylglucosaminyltransferase [bacterium]|nr:undecaprenyldiphospho-muramoylpentapeptide beta-N-acetylglucosaminyltransferase [bacterium]
MRGIPVNPALSMNRESSGEKGGVKILIAAGGSGGHIFPAVALARRLKQLDGGVQILFVGSEKALDRRIFEKEGLRYSLLSANKMPYRIGPASLLFLIKLFADLVRSLCILAFDRPNVVLGFGGYVSWPIVFTAYLLRIPRIVHEQNVIPGRSNKVLFNLADKIALSFSETARSLSVRDSKKAVLTGNPIRASLFKGDRPNGIMRLGLDEKRFTLLVIGGSQGSHFLNETVIDAVSRLDTKMKARLQVIHITGLKDYDWAAKEYERIGIPSRVFSFIDRIEDAYSASNLIVTRSGASAIFEIALFGRPMILIPYPFAGSHQAENAKVFSERGAAVKMEEKDLSADSLMEEFIGLIGDRPRLEKMADGARRLGVPEASDNLAKLVLGSRNNVKE